MAETMSCATTGSLLTDDDRHCLSLHERRYSADPVGQVDATGWTRYSYETVRDALLGLRAAEAEYQRLLTAAGAMVQPWTFWDILASDAPAWAESIADVMQAAMDSTPIYNVVNRRGDYYNVPGLRKAEQIYRRLSRELAAAIEAATAVEVS